MSLNVNNIRLDVLAVGAHPDDVELGCAGTLLKLKTQGKLTGIVDLTQGELGTRGSASLRAQEAAAASAALGLSARLNLGLPDGFYRADEASIRKLISVLRSYQPKVVLAPAPTDRHPDHARGALLVREACFLSGLRRIETTDASGAPQLPWRPPAVFHYIQDYYLNPTLVVDITAHLEAKMEVIRRYGSQFYNPDSTDPETVLSSKSFFDFVRGRAQHLGRLVQAEYGEGFISQEPLLVDNLLGLRT